MLRLFGALQRSRHRFLDIASRMDLVNAGAGLSKPKHLTPTNCLTTYRRPSPRQSSSAATTYQTLLLYEPSMESHCLENAKTGKLYSGKVVKRVTDLFEIRLDVGCARGFFPDSDIGSNYYHPENPNRIKYAYYKIMHNLQLLQTIRIDFGRVATDDELLLYHTRRYVDLISSTQLLDAEACSELAKPYDSVYLNNSTHTAARRAAGCALDLVDKICTGEVPNGFALIRPPGHHATADACMGYSFFNNAALAANHALKQHKLHRILIFDWDVHHGNGTQAAFYDDPRVFYVSIHRSQHGRYWPHLAESNYDHIGRNRGAGFNINVPLNEIGCNFADYFFIFHHLLMPIICEFAPELIIVSAGFDSAAGDSKGEMSLEPAAFAHFTHWLKMFADGRIAMLLEGGYNLGVLAECITQCLYVLSSPQLRQVMPRLSFQNQNLGIGKQLWQGPKHSVRQTVDLLITALRPYWACLQAKQLLPPRNAVSTPSMANKSSVSDSPPVESPASSTVVENDNDDVQFLFATDGKNPQQSRTADDLTAKVDGSWSAADMRAISEAVAEMNGENIENTRVQLAGLHLDLSLSEMQSDVAAAALNSSNEMHHDDVEDKGDDDNCTVLRTTPEQSFSNNNDCLDFSDDAVPNDRQQQNVVALTSCDTVIAYDDRMLLHDNSFQDTEPHVECPQRLASIYEALRRHGLLKQCRVLSQPIKPVEDDAVLVFHSYRLLQEVDKFAATSDEQLECYNERSARASIFANQNTSMAARVAAGGVVQCVDEVMSGRARNGFAIVRPPGHHAEHDRCFGFCFFNNVVIAARHAQRKWSARRVLIVDWDVHHGNGVQDAFYDDPTVLYISLHQLNIFPGQKHQPTLTGGGDGVGYNLNIGWNPPAVARNSGRRGNTSAGASVSDLSEIRGDAAYMNAFLRCIMPMAYEFDPDLVLVSAGFDSAKDDLLGDCNVTPTGFGLMTHMLMGLASGHVILALEGGYNLRVIGECAAACTAALLSEQVASIDVQRRRVAEPQSSDDLWQALSCVCASHKWKMLIPPRFNDCVVANKPKVSQSKKRFF